MQTRTGAGGRVALLVPGFPRPSPLPLLSGFAPAAFLPRPRGLAFYAWAPDEVVVDEIDLVSRMSVFHLLITINLSIHQPINFFWRFIPTT